MRGSGQPPGLQRDFSGEGGGVNQKGQDSDQTCERPAQSYPTEM